MSPIASELAYNAALAAQAADERAVYNEENGKWHRHDADFRVRDSNDRGPVKPVLEVAAPTHAEAFELLYGHAPIVPAPVRAPRREAL